MGKKKHGGVLSDLFEIAAMLPWWIGVALAIGAYAVFHSLAVVEFEAGTDSPQLGALFVGHPWESLASVLQYVLPLLLLVSALVSAIADERRRASKEPPRPPVNTPAAEPRLD